jgi:hypothetical protein
MAQGGGRELSKVSRDIFFKILNRLFLFWHAFLKEKAIFRENQNVTSHRKVGGGGAPGGAAQLSKIGQKKCHVLFEWPLFSICFYALIFISTNTNYFFKLKLDNYFSVHKQSFILFYYKVLGFNELPFRVMKNNQI